MGQPTYWRVGELAKRTGLSVRALHWYDEIGLLSPSHRTEAGYRLYTAQDIARLEQIRSLRQLGFSLEEIRDCLHRPGFQAQGLLALHIARLQESIELQRALCTQLEGLQRFLAADGEAPVEALLKALEMMSRMEEYYTPEQMAEIKKRGEQLGEDHIRQVEAEWPQLIARVRAEMDAGADPADPRVQALVKRWQELVAEFTGGNPGIQQALNRMYQQEASVRERTGIDPALMEYVQKAMEAGKA